MAGPTIAGWLKAHVQNSPDVKNTCSQLKPLIVLGRKLGRLRIWNAGTTPCVNVEAATFDKRCPFPASDESHDTVTKWFIVQYNLGLSLTT
jgi:hypothetical protein